jgi:hypothetical protein
MQDAKTKYRLRWPLLGVICISAGVFNLPYVFLVLTFVCLLVFRIVHRQSLFVSSEIILLTGLFVFLYTSAFPYESETLAYAAFPLAFLIGLWVVPDGAEGESSLNLALGAMVIGATIRALINSLLSLNNYGLITPARVLPDVWIDVPISATIHTLMAVPLIGSSYYFLILNFKDSWKNLVVRLATVMSLVIIFLFNVSSATRTIFYIFLIVTASFLLNVVFFRRNKIPLVFMGFILIFISLTVFWTFFRDLGYVLGIEVRANREVLDFGNDSRLSGSIGALRNFWNASDGGRELSSQLSVRYVHNFWLDAYDLHGLLPFVILILFTLAFFYIVYQILSFKSISYPSRVHILGLSVAFIVQMMVEPSLSGAPFFFVQLCYLAGVLKSRVISQAELAKDQND